MRLEVNNCGVCSNYPVWFQAAIRRLVTSTIQLIRCIYLFQIIYKVNEETNTSAPWVMIVALQYNFRGNRKNEVCNIWNINIL